eukprot:2469932-Rhodomonas_salina.2
MQPASSDTPHAENSADSNAPQPAKKKAMVPMSKAQADEEDSKIEEVWDEDTGRWRCVSHMRCDALRNQGETTAFLVQLALYCYCGRLQLILPSMSGADVGYAATRLVRGGGEVGAAIGLRVRYAMCDTEIAYGDGCSHAICGTEIAYAMCGAEIARADG